MKDDTISRQEALRVFEEHCYPVRYDHNSIEKGMTLSGIVEVLNMTPPAQPVAKDINVPAKDCISRAQAIEAIKKDKIDLTDPNVVAVFKATGDFEKVETQVMTCDRHIKILKGLPSAQPETAKRIVGKSRDGMTLWYQCDMCNEPVDAQDTFCRGCGRRLTDG